MKQEIRNTRLQLIRKLHSKTIPDKKIQKNIIFIYINSRFFIFRFILQTQHYMYFLLLLS